ncbi:uncharacterized protein LOC110915702 [Helianthus annuus]|uniref:uncharacterized protein LOC110915702 n=1 Tax=Helianthus annuus TaxID=4232 RepID=UPI000B8F1D82|nr:uncharacterized protein LOC110915702 [Helianthus annuus]
MSDYFSGRRYHQLPWLGHWSDRNVVPSMPYAFNSFFYYPNLFAVNDGGGYLPHHRYQSGNNFASFAALPSTNNLRVGTWRRGGLKAYYRFHGGIGDGCCGLAFRNTVDYTAARPLQLFDALDPINIQMTTDHGGFVNIPMIGPSCLPEEASNGTGVFLPAYPKRIRGRKGMHVRGRRGDGLKRRGGQMMQEDIVAKPFVAGDVAKKDGRKDMEEIPIELLLPAEWTY